MSKILGFEVQEILEIFHNLYASSGGTMSTARRQTRDMALCVGV